ncbi:MAG: hypothetical protein AAFR56_04915, partial [Chloroflexota bacterium]
PPMIDCTGNPCEPGPIDMTPDGKLIVAGMLGGKGDCFLVDGYTGELIRWLGVGTHDRRVWDASSVSITPDGEYVAVADHDHPKEVRIYRVRDDVLVKTMKVPYRPIVKFAPRGNVLAIGTWRGVTLYEFNTS